MRHQVELMLSLVTIWLLCLSCAAAPLSARIHCEYRDLNGDSLLLNCSLAATVAAQTAVDSSSVLADLDVPSASNSGASNSPSSSGVTLRVGLERRWRTPWESLSINHDIIRTLFWRRSRLSELGEWAFKGLRYLQGLDLSYNRLTHLAAHTFRNFELDLLELDLSGNLFTHVPVELFTNGARVRALESLRMNDNPITALHRRPFDLLATSLKLIEFNNCQIRSIDVDTFDDMKQLESISLTGNYLRFLSESTFSGLVLRAFYIHDNPLICDCHMRWLLNYLRSVDYQQQAYEIQAAAASAASLGISSSVVATPSSRLVDGPSGSSYFNAMWAAQQQGHDDTKQLSVAAAAQSLLRCDQPNSLKSASSFLDINPDSFMCDVQITEPQAQADEALASLEAGDDAVLVCEVYGDPAPSIYWSFGEKTIGKRLNVDDKYAVHESPPVGTSPQATNRTSQLRIRNLQAVDLGVYTCTAEIPGSTSRRQITYALRSLRGAGLISADGISLDDNLGAVSNVLARATSSLLADPRAHWRLLVAFAVCCALVAFALLLVCYACWRCRRATKRRRLTSVEMIAGDDIKHNSLKKNKKQQLVNEYERQQLAGGDHVDYAAKFQLLDGTATLATNKSIRMAYPNANTINSNTLHHGVGGTGLLHLHNASNDIYGNSSLLTTTSTATGASYVPANQSNGTTHTVAIDTCNQTPRYHLINNQPTLLTDNCYYDDLRYNNHSSNGGGSNDGEQASSTIQYSPIMRADPTVPLYATLKPKLQLQRQQQQQQQFANYASYSTILRGQNGPMTYQEQQQPSVPLPRRNAPQPAYQPYQQVHHNGTLPPPPPPPPPLKPKRTFEYGAPPTQHRFHGVHAGDLHSESNAYLLGDESSSAANTPPTLEYDGQSGALVAVPGSVLGRYRGDEVCYEPLLLRRTHDSLLHDDCGSATSLDEEDLDLNDLKDFEDVTFDNLRKPGQPRIPPSSSSNFELRQAQHKQKYLTAVTAVGGADQRQDPGITNSEQSLLLKSSSEQSSSTSSSENTINQLQTQKQKQQTTNDLLDNTQTTMVNDGSNGTMDIVSGEKIYEETEI